MNNIFTSVNGSSNIFELEIKTPVKEIDPLYDEITKNGGNFNHEDDESFIEFVVDELTFTPAQPEQKNELWQNPFMNFTMSGDPGDPSMGIDGGGISIDFEEYSEMVQPFSESVEGGNMAEPYSTSSNIKKAINSIRI